jgi:Mor family transcriptional regulator
MVNIQIIRTFTRLRELIAENADLRQKIEELEKRYDGQFEAVFEAIRQLLTSPEVNSEEIGFRTEI